MFIKQYDAATQTSINKLFEQIETEVYDMPRAAIEAVGKVPLKKGLNKGIQSFTYKVYSALGMAKLVASDAKELPPISGAFKLYNVLVKNIGDSYSFTQSDIDAWLFANESLDKTDALAARKAIEECLDTVLLKGDSEGGIEGLFTNANVPRVTLSAFNGKIAHKDLTLDQIAQHIQECLDTVFQNTKGATGVGTVKPDTILFPRSSWVTLTTKFTGTDSKISYLEALKARFAPQGLINFDLCNAGNGVGVEGKDRMMVYKNDVENVFGIVTEPLRVLPAQYQGLNAIFNLFARTAGTAFRRPTSAVYADGV